MKSLEDTKKIYELPEILEDLGTRDYLYKPEQLIFDMIKDELQNMSMFEMGVGGGRMTKFFAPLVREYYGMDYSKKMIDICKKKFPKLFFEVFDVRDLDVSKTYDFVLFGLNGIDHIFIEDRLKVLKNIYIITNKIFCFSTHIKTNIRNCAVMDDPYHKEIATMYINPKYQYEILDDIGYKNIRVFDLSAKNITNNMLETKDHWIYYLCEIKK